MSGLPCGIPDNLKAKGDPRWPKQRPASRTRHDRQGRPGQAAPVQFNEGTRDRSAEVAARPTSSETPTPTQEENDAGQARRDAHCRARGGRQPRAVAADAQKRARRAKQAGGRTKPAARPGGYDHARIDPHRRRSTPEWPTSLSSRCALALRQRSGEGEVSARPVPSAGHRRMVAGRSRQPWNWWQLGYRPGQLVGTFGHRRGLLSAYSQTVAMCPGDHWRSNDKGGRDRVSNSALSRILRKPNAYQSISDFMLNLTRSLYLDGNAYALALRNDRFEIDELHLMDPTRVAPQVASDRRRVLSARRQRRDRPALGNEPLLVPQRDVLHVRLHTSRRRYPYPAGRRVAARCRDAGHHAATARSPQQQIAFYMNQARPTAVLSTDLILDKDQVQALRDRWNEQVEGIAAGRHADPDRRPQGAAVVRASARTPSSPRC